MPGIKMRLNDWALRPKSSGLSATTVLSGVTELKYDFSIAVSAERAHGCAPLRHFIFAISNAQCLSPASRFYRRCFYVSYRFVMLSLKVGILIASFLQLLFVTPLCATHLIGFWHNNLLHGWLVASAQAKLGGLGLAACCCGWGRHLACMLSWAIRRFGFGCQVQ